MPTNLLHPNPACLSGRIILDHPMSDAEFEDLCRSNDVIQFERTAEGDIRMNPPTGDDTSAGNARIIVQLGNWWSTHRRGRFYDSNAGFFLPDRSVLSPDAAYVCAEKIQGVSKEERRRIRHVCPDFVIELLSESDSLPKTKKKMEAWINNGVTLGWLVDPYQRMVWVYQAGQIPVVVTDTVVQGSGPVEGFALNLDDVWSCYED
jgi:Uma2 family endonuclease